MGTMTPPRTAAPLQAASTPPIPPQVPRTPLRTACIPIQAAKPRRRYNSPRRGPLCGTCAKKRCAAPSTGGCAPLFLQREFFRWAFAPQVNGARTRCAAIAAASLPPAFALPAPRASSRGCKPAQFPGKPFYWTHCVPISTPTPLLCKIVAEKPLLPLPPASKRRFCPPRRPPPRTGQVSRFGARHNFPAAGVNTEKAFFQTHKPTACRAGLAASLQGRPCGLSATRRNAARPTPHWDDSHFPDAACSGAPPA